MVRPHSVAASDPGGSACGAGKSAAGSGFEHVVRCGVWLVNLEDFAGMHSVYETFFPEPRPARATVRADLVVGKIEIDCIALVP